MLNLPPFADFTPDLDYASLHLYIKDNYSGLTAIAQYTSPKPLLIEETWPFWFQGLDANTLESFCLNTRSLTSGWVSQFFGKTIEQYATEPNQPLDDYNTMTWFKNCEAMAPTMKAP